MSLRPEHTVILEAVDQASKYFEGGQQVVEAAIGKASRGEVVLWDEVKRLDLIKIQLRNQVRRFEYLVEGMDPYVWKPWRIDEHNKISCAKELMDLCELQAKHKTIPHHEIARLANETREWFTSMKETKLPPKTGVEDHYQPKGWKGNDCHFRDMYWKELETNGKKYAAIRDTWNQLPAETRENICPNQPVAVSADLVRGALRRLNDAQKSSK